MRRASQPVEPIAFGAERCSNADVTELRGREWEGVKNNGTGRKKKHRRRGDKTSFVLRLDWSDRLCDWAQER